MQEVVENPQCPDGFQHFMNPGKTPSFWMCGSTHDDNGLQPPIYTFNLYASGADTRPLNIETYNSDKYGHLTLDWSFHSTTPSVSTVPITAMDVTIFDPITGAPGDNNTYEPVYYKHTDENEYIETTQSDPTGVFVGLRGNFSFYYRDDVTKCRTSREKAILMTVELDEHKLHDQSTVGKKDNTSVKYRNTKPLILNSVKPRVNDAIQLNITSTGINEFNINREKWEQSEIHFVITIQDSFGFNILDSNTFDTGLTIGLVDEDGNPIDPESYNINTIEKGMGSYKGSLVCNETMENVQLTASLEFTQISGYKTDAITAWLNNYRPYSSASVPEMGNMYRFQFSDQVMFTGEQLTDNINIQMVGTTFLTNTNGVISDVIVNFEGQDLTSPPKIEVQDPTGSGAVLAPRFVPSAGSISDVVVLSGGEGYSETPVLYFLTNAEATLPNATAVVDYNYQPNIICVTPPDDNSVYPSIWALDSGPLTRLLQIDSTGKLTTSEALSGITTQPGTPVDIKTDNNRDVYVATQNKVVKIDPSDRELTGIYWSRDILDMSTGPSCIEVDNVHIYICDESVVKKLNKFDPTNTESIQDGDTTNLPGNSQACILQSDGILNVLTQSNELVRVDTSNMSTHSVVSLTAGTYGSLSITTDSNIYMVRDGRYLCMVDSNNVFSEVHDFGAGSAISSICGDSRGYIWLPDDNAEKIWVIDAINSSNIQLNPIPSTLEPGMLNYFNYPAIDDSTGRTLRAVGDWTGFGWLHKFGYIPESVKLLTGESSMFNVNSIDGTYNLRKFNEDHDASATVQTYALQPWLSDQHNLFNEALRSMLGDVNSEPTSLGKTIYEKISNFVNNNNDVDECNIDIIHNQSLTFENDIQLYNLNYPPSIKRLVDICSVKHSKIYGTLDMTTNIFDMYTDYTNKDTRENLGYVLDFTNYMVTPGETIVAYEKFSKKFTPILTTFPISGNIDDNDNIINTGMDTTLVDSTTEQYPLSAYSPTWGWRLVAPMNASGQEILNYYSFYSYNNTINNKQVEGVIDWSSDQTTLTQSQSGYEDWSKDTGILDNIFEHQLRTGLSLFDT